LASARIVAAAGTLLLAGLLSGCSASREPVRGPEKEPAAEPAAAPAPAKPVTVRVIDEKEFAEVLQRHRGKVVLVDFWATWCLPCMELFPHTVALHDKFAGRGLVVISVSMDQPSDEPKVLKFLQSKGAAFDNFISRYGGGSKSMESFRVSEGTLPHFQLFNRDGKLHKLFVASSAFTQKDIDQAVKELLQAGG